MVYLTFEFLKSVMILQFTYYVQWQKLFDPVAKTEAIITTLLLYAVTFVIFLFPLRKSATPHLAR